jgi:GrpB-like predicted nucleotidyltransferase (UPF0157 family)
MTDPIEVVAYDPAWPAWFAEVAGPLRTALGGVAVRIDHVGSTAVPGLDAKPVLDVQISVRTFDEPFAGPLTGLGYVFRDNEDLTKRYFREPPSASRTHVHVRRAGSFHEQITLLFRDYLRADAAARAGYAALKHDLAVRFRHDRIGYTEAKSDFVWSVIRQADDWAQLTGWHPGPSDA